MIAKFKKPKMDKVKCANNYSIPDTPMLVELAYSEDLFPAARAFIEHPETFKNGLPNIIAKQLYTSVYNLHWITSEGKIYSRGSFKIDADNIKGSLQKS